MARRVYTRKALKDEVGIDYSNVELHRKEEAGTFPQRFYLSPQKPVWDADEIHEWLEERKRASRGGVELETATPEPSPPLPSEASAIDRAARSAGSQTKTGRAKAIAPPRRQRDLTEVPA
jgi:hypothetical protein